MSAQPLAILCEITYRCNLQCPYCYNPINLQRYRDELDAASWIDTLAQAARMGIVQAHFSGGEPTLRSDLPQMIEAATQHGLYTNLITQGTFLRDTLLDRLLEAGLAHIQISIQAPDVALGDSIAHARVHEAKFETLRRVSSRDVALTLNCVLHRSNHDSLEDVIALAERLDIARLELANVQFYGWAYRNRLALMPTYEQVARGSEIVERARDRLKGRMEIVYVLPDYFGEFPKPCMNGWGTTFLTVTPNGDVLPCPAAAAIKTLQFENVTKRPLAEIWNASPAFETYRGTAWMPEPCRSCDRRTVDFGGCRCQAFLLTGDAGVTDPACVLSPNHDLLQTVRESAGSQHAAVPRRMETETPAP